MTATWDVVTEWQMCEPVEHHVPLPKVVFRAGIAVALLMGDVAFAVTLFLGFIGGLRPGEAVKLLRNDIVLPQDVGRRSGPAFVVIREPGKARRRGVQAQQVTIQTLNALLVELEGGDGHRYLVTISPFTGKTTVEVLQSGS